MSESGKSSKIRIGRSLLSNEKPLIPLLEMPTLAELQQYLIALAVTFGIYETPGMQKAFIVASLASLIVTICATGNRYNLSMLQTGISRTPLAIVIPAVYFTGVSTFFAIKGHSNLTLGFGTSLAYFALFVSALGMTLFTNDHRPFYRALVLGGTYVALHSGLQMWRRTPDPGWLLSPVRWWHDPGSYHTIMRLGLGSFPWASRIAAWLNVISGCSLGLIAYSKSWKEKAFWALCLFLMVAATFFSGSRMSLVLLIVIILIFMSRKPGVARYVSMGIGALGVMSLGVMATMHRSPIRGDGSLRGRFTMWKLCLDIARQHPIFGNGYMSFREAWPKYAASHGFGYSKFQDPHNVYMLMLTDGGIIMIGSGLLFVGSIIYYAISAIRSNLPRGARTLLLSFLAGLCMVPVNDFIDDAMSSRCIQAMAAVLCGMACGMCRKCRVEKG